MSEAVIQAWAAAATGIPVERVIWANQKGPRPATPWIKLLTIVDDEVGEDALTVVDNEAGGENDILHRQDGLRRLVVSVQCFGEPTGADHPVKVLRRLRSRLPAAIAPLEAGGLSSALVGSINDISALVADAEREARAQVDVTFYELERFEEAGVSIDSVEVNITSPVVDQFTVELEEPSP